MTKDEALRLAIKSLCCVRDMVKHPDNLEYIEHQVAKIEAALEAKDEPVAWLHRFIEGGISIGLKPLDLERHPERWEPLYTEPRPCLTCEALARTVMLDQTSHDTQRTWVGLMRGVRVEGNAVVITVKGGNDEARALCGELINEMEKNT